MALLSVIVRPASGKPCVRYRARAASSVAGSTRLPTCSIDHPKTYKDLQGIWIAETRDDANNAF